jgi:hypothetical protein
VARQKGAAGRPPAEPADTEMPLDELARAVLARELRPRVAQVRRLAEGVLAARAKPKKRKGDKKKGEKKRKLARIPGGKKRAS